jgi:hypothetical protein
MYIIEPRYTFLEGFNVKVKACFDCKMYIPLTFSFGAHIPELMFAKDHQDHRTGIVSLDEIPGFRDISKKYSMNIVA